VRGFWKRIPRIECDLDKHSSGSKPNSCTVASICHSVGGGGGCGGGGYTSTAATVTTTRLN